MKRNCAWALAVVLCVIASAGVVQAANTGTITVTVSLASVVSVNVNQSSWNLGAVQLASVSSPTTFTATVGNSATQLQIEAANPTSGWTIGPAAGADVFRVEVTSPALSLSTSYQILAANVAPYNAKSFGMIYHAPTSDTKGSAADESFTITLKASSAP